jgi:hypothetical protein
MAARCRRAFPVPLLAIEGPFVSAKTTAFARHQFGDEIIPVAFGELGL